MAITKKKSAENKKESVENKKEPIENKEISKTCLIEIPKKEFKEIEIVQSQKIDINYISIRRKIIEIGRSIGIISTKEEKEKRKEGFKKYLYWLFIEKYNLNKYQESIYYLYWMKYCNWFNSKFNKEDIKNEKS